MARRKPSPDTRPSWRDAPVIRDYKMPNGARVTEVDPDYERRYREHLLSTGAQPNYKLDPTYNLKRRK